MAGHSAETCGLSAGMDADGHAVRRWEIRLRACRLASFRGWVRNHTIAQRAPQYGAGLKLSMFRVRSDAMSRGDWKVNVMDLLAAFVYDGVREREAWCDIWPRVHKRHAWGELAEVKGTGHARGMLGLMDSSLASVGLGAPWGSDPRAIERFLPLPPPPPSPLPVLAAPAEPGGGLKALLASAGGPPVDVPPRPLRLNSENPLR